MSRNRPGIPLDLMEVKSDKPDMSEAEVVPCFLSSSPRAIRRAFHYGGIAVSRQHYIHPPHILDQRYSLLKSYSFYRNSIISLIMV